MTAPDLTIKFQARDQALAALIERIAGGDQNALTALYDATNRLVYALALRILGDATAAEEVLLDVFMQVWRQASRYDSRQGQPHAWLVMMARSRAIDRLRVDRQEARQTEPLEAAHAVAAPANVEADATLSEMLRLINAALDRVPPEQREVIELAFYTGLSHGEIAAQLKEPLGTVKTRARLGMKKLREILRPVLEGA